MFGEILRAITRRKWIDPSTLGESKLARVLTVFDLTALGVGATLGRYILKHITNYNHLKISLVKFLFRLCCIVIQKV